MWLMETPSSGNIRAWLIARLVRARLSRMRAPIACVTTQDGDVVSESLISRGQSLFGPTLLSVISISAGNGRGPGMTRGMAVSRQVADRTLLTEWPLSNSGVGRWKESAVIPATIPRAAIPFTFMTERIAPMRAIELLPVPIGGVGRKVLGRVGSEWLNPSSPRMRSARFDVATRRAGCLSRALPTSSESIRPRSVTSSGEGRGDTSSKGRPCLR